MAQIIRKYKLDPGNNWYAQVHGNDGVMREVKVKQATQPSNTKFLTLAATAEAAEAADAAEAAEAARPHYFCATCGQETTRPVAVAVPAEMEVLDA